MKIKGRIIFNGKAEGEALVSSEPISFYGGVDPETGIVVEKKHELEGRKISGKILVFPSGKGSTVGSYTLYRLRKNGLAPLAMINKESETIIAVGAIISEIPLVDQIDITQLKTGDFVSIDGENVIVK